MVEAIVLSIIPFNANWLKSTMLEIIQAILFDVVGYEVKPHFITTEELANYGNNETATPKEATKPSTETTEDNHVLGREQFNAHNTFDTFVIGPGNRFPHAASLAVAEAPTKSVQSIIYLWRCWFRKTHLMHAIGHHVLDNNPDAKVIYTSRKNSQMNLLNQFVITKVKLSEKDIVISTSY